MKLTLTPTDVSVLQDVLQFETQKLDQQIMHADRASARKTLNDKRAAIAALADKILDFHFDFDAEEIDLMVEVVGKQDQEAWRELVGTDARDYRHMLQAREAQLERLMNKLVEVSAMV